jgi:hypothetical protein
MLSDAALVKLSVGIHQQRAFFPDQPGCRIAPPSASDNYYYDE